MIENGRKVLITKEFFRALLTDLSEAFDSIPHELIITNLSAYGFDFKALKLIYSYVNNGKQRVRVNGKFQ